MEPWLTGEGLGDSQALEFRDCHQPSRFRKGKGNDFVTISQVCNDKVRI